VVVASAVVAGLAPAASAQLLVGVDDAREPIWDIDPTTNVASQYLAGFGANAMAVDEASQTLYFMPNTVTLYRWSYGTPGAVPVLIGNTRTASSTPFASITGLAFGGGKLYGSRTLGSTADPEGFYEVSTTDAFITLRYSIATASNGSSPYDFGGFDYDAGTGKFYGISDFTVSGTGNAGIYEVDPVGQTLTLIGGPPSSADPIPDIDGLAAGAGKVYLVEDRAVQTGGRIHVFNLATRQYETPLLTPWFFNETFASATYSPSLANALRDGAVVPEPAALALPGLVAVLARRRRG
jgi:hypothetical protein